MKTPRVEDFDPKARVKSLLDLGMGNLPRIEKPPSSSSSQKQQVVGQAVPEQKQKGSKEADASMLASKQVSKQAYLQALVRQRASYAATFRYPPDLLKKMDGLHHKFWLHFGSKVSRNAIAVLALAYVLEDLEEKGEQSDFYKLLIGK